MRVLLLAPLVLALAACGSTAPSVAPSQPSTTPPTSVDTTPSAAPSASGAARPTTGPISASATFDGVVVTLRASEGRIGGGDPIQLRVEVLNAGLSPVTWMSGGCELLNGFGVEGPPVAAAPPGREWPGTAGLAKFSATSQFGGLDVVRPANLPDDQMFACPADLRYEAIDPGQTIATDARWTARTMDGAPAPGGAYRITYAFPFLARAAADEVMANPPDAKPIKTALAIEVGDSPAIAVPAALAIDAALADPRVAAWIGALPKEHLAGAEIRLVDGRWRFTIRRLDDRVAVVTIDPATGAIEDVQLPT